MDIKKRPTREEEIEWARVCREKKEREAANERDASRDRIFQALEEWIKAIVISLTGDQSVEDALNAINAKQCLKDVIEQELKD